MSDPHPRDRRDERGIVMVMAALAMITLILFGALAVDVGGIWASRTQSQNANDSAALAAAQSMIIQASPASVDLATARAKGISYAAANSSVANPSVTVRNEDFTFGQWDLSTRTLKTGVNLNDPDVVTGVRVNVLMDGAVNERSPSFLSRIIGRDGFDVTNTSTAYLGFEGDWDEGEFDMPIAIDSCDLTNNNGCGDNFCETVADPPNPCEITPARQQTGPGAGEVTCLEFMPTTTQNACWTAFSGTNPTISTPRMLDILDDGNPRDIDSSDSFFLDNGTKQPVLRDIGERFYGEGGYPAPGEFGAQGHDRYNPKNGIADSWVVKLPVVECQDLEQCAGGTPAAIVGAVCFEIREVLYQASEPKQIKGRFLCPDSGDANVQDLYDTYCRESSEGSGPGGCNFGFRADTVVLVE